jgi:protein-S-isoprenylcysteine O-methyltransferase Ste14
MIEQSGRWRDRPNVLPWPPLIYGGGIVLALVLGWLVPFGWAPGSIVRVAGGVVMLSGLGLDGSAMLVMRRGRANILPHRAATALITSGPFAVSRNPIYLGNTFLLIGAAAALANPWFLPVALLSAAAVDRLAIRREEAHLAARFGEAWRGYAKRTARWIGMVAGSDG